MTRPHSRLPLRSAFSAPEIVMAVALIACCYGVIIHWDSYARYRALDNNCMSNVKQLGLGLAMYAADNNYRLPLRGDDWQAVFPYVKNTALFLCARAPVHPNPPAPVGPSEGPAPQAGPPPAKRPASSYSEDNTPVVSDYLLNPTAQADDTPDTIFAGDDAPDRHRHREWFGARADGAVAYFPAAEWQTRLKNFADTGKASATGGPKDGRSN